MNKNNCCALVFVLFLLLSSPPVYGLVNQAVKVLKLGDNVVADSNNCQKDVGVVLHSFVFLGLLLACCSNKRSKKYTGYAVVMAVVFGVLNLKMVYSEVGVGYGRLTIVGDKKANSGNHSDGGCPTYAGVVIHAVVFVVINCVVMSAMGLC